MTEKFARQNLAKGHLKGFTLIELMIVVAILGTLATVAMPKFADMIRRAREGAMKGNLGALRSAFSIYSAENEGVNICQSSSYDPDPGDFGWVSSWLDNHPEWSLTTGPAGQSGLEVFVPKYIDSIPTARLVSSWGSEHEGDCDLGIITTVYENDSAKLNGVKANHNMWEEWYYNRDTGQVWINCTYTDTKGSEITSW